MFEPENPGPESEITEQDKAYIDSRREMARNSQAYLYLQAVLPPETLEAIRAGYADWGLPYEHKAPEDKPHIDEAPDRISRDAYRSGPDSLSK